jgi:hypothetical protein
MKNNRISRAYAPDGKSRNEKSFPRSMMALLARVSRSKIRHDGGITALTPQLFREPNRPLQTQDPRPAGRVSPCQKIKINQYLNAVQTQANMLARPGPFPMRVDAGARARQRQKML